ncbi:MAG: hypothetical protein JW900_10995 [Anaerolineae bacterium]|nr:hypothetical protein [Anaerolineae bacterium]
MSQHHRRPSRTDATYLLAALLLKGTRAIPASQNIAISYRVSPLLARLLCFTNAAPAPTIRRNLETFFPSRSPERIEQDVRRQLAITAWNAMVMNALPRLSHQEIANLVPVEGTAALDACLSGSQPVLVLGFHFGLQPLIVAAILSARGYPIHAIAHVGQPPGGTTSLGNTYYRQIQHIGEQFPTIDPRQGVQREMLDVLRDNECLYITPDYMLPQEERQPESAFQAPVQLLGHRAYVQTGGVRLAKRHQASPVTVFSVPAEGGGMRLVVEPLALPTPGCRPDELRQDLQACIRQLEKHLLEHPHLWLDLKRHDLPQRLQEAKEAR